MYRTVCNSIFIFWFYDKTKLIHQRLSDPQHFFFQECILLWFAIDTPRHRDVKVANKEVEQIYLR